MKTLRAELLKVIYRFYPHGVMHFDRRNTPDEEPVYMDTKEHCRLMTACARGRREWPRWKAMIRRLGIVYSVQDDSLSLVCGSVEPAYSGRVWVTKEAKLNVHVSLLGPYFAIQRPGAPGEEPVVRDILSEIATTYPGYRTIPPEVGNEIVPDVAFENWGFGEHTIYTLLFASSTWRDVHTYDPAKE